MCGVVGYQPFDPDGPAATQAFTRLFAESTVRGLHAFGLATPECSLRSYTASEIASAFKAARPTIAHARYCTSGDWRTLGNNQPLVVGATALAFNGVIHMGTKAEYEAAFGVMCEADNDGEVFLRRLQAGVDPADFLANLYGSFAGVWLQGDRLYAGRNQRRPLWRAIAHGAKWYASTRDIFIRAGFAHAEPVPVGVEAA